ncbi:MAG: RNA recognition motif-containing protein [Planctomycetota bacterium]|jgi:RNA recognition motif-containing protein
MSKTIYVGNLPREATSDGLRAIFEADGREVESIKLPTSGKSSKIRGFAFIIMATEEQAEAAKVALKGTLIGDREIKFGEARDKKVETNTGGSYEDDMGGPHGGGGGGGGGGSRRGR